MDNDVYGHVNNVVYYSYFDTVVNQYLIEQGALDIEKSEVFGLVVETACQYFAPIAFPDLVNAGCASASSATAACATRSASFATTRTSPPRKATSSTSTWSGHTSTCASDRRLTRRAGEDPGNGLVSCPVGS